MNGLLLCRTGFDAGLAFRAMGPSALIGRAQDCPVQILDDALSRHHARIFVEQGGLVVIEDLGSSLGTEVNGEFVAFGEAMPLAHFDVIRLGKVIELVWIELARVPATEVLAASLVGPAGERVPLRVGDNSIGSQEECDLIVPDPSVARRHAVLTLSPRGVSVRAEASLTVKVCGVELTRADLADEDILEFSPTAEFRIETFSGLGQVPAAAEAALASTTPDAERPAADESTTAPDILADTTGSGISDGDTIEEPAADVSHSTQEVPALGADAPATERVLAGPADTAQITATWPAEAPALDEEEIPDAGDTAALPIAELEEALREARERQHALVEEAALEDTDTGRVSKLQSETVDLGTSVRRPKVDVPAGMQPKDFKATRREIAYRITVRVPQGETRVTLLREGRHVLGRSENCRVVVPHPSVSREHAELHVGTDGVRVRDLKSSNGTFSAGTRISDLIVKPGETIAFGDSEAKFEEI